VSAVANLAPNMGPKYRNRIFSSINKNEEFGERIWHIVFYNFAFFMCFLKMYFMVFFISAVPSVIVEFIFV